MFIELVDALRCGRPHALTWLVASSFEMADRHIVRGVLGCPECGARYPIERGIADFRGGQVTADPTPPAEAPDPEMAVRLAALLDLVEPRGLVVLAGSWTAAAHELAAIAEGVRVLGVEPTPGTESGWGVSLALTGEELPLRPGTARGIALDAAHAAPSYLASAARALRANGRLLAPVTAPIPADLTEVARDERYWLAVKPAVAGPVVPLRRAPAG